MAFPMYVGMNRTPAPAKAIVICVPHVRGDEPPYVMLQKCAERRSPCTWG